MTEKVTGRDRGDGATRKSLLQQIHADFPGNSASTQRARLLVSTVILNDVKQRVFGHFG